MRRLPFLLISALFLTLAGCLIYFWIASATAPIRPEDDTVLTVTRPAFRIFPGAYLVAAAIGFVLWVCALVHMLTNRTLEGADRIVWTIVIVFLNVLGAVLYFLVSPRSRVAPSSPPTLR